MRWRRDWINEFGNTGVEWTERCPADVCTIVSDTDRMDSKDIFSLPEMTINKGRKRNKINKIRYLVEVIGRFYVGVT